MSRRPSLVVLAVGLLGIAAHALVVPERWQEISYDGVELFILAAMVWGIRRHRPDPARPWWLLAGGLALLAVGDIVYNALTRMNGHEVFPSAADAFYVASYGVLSWGVVAVLHGRRRQRDRTALIDAALVTVVAAVGTWVYLVDPSAYGGVPLLEGLISAAYPVGDVVLLAFLARLLISSNRRPPAERVLALGLGLLLVADVGYARLALTGDYAVGGWLDVIYHLSYLCFPVAAAHPTMRALARPEADFAPSGRSRLWLLAAVSLVLPACAAVEVAGGNNAEAITLAAASAAAFFLLTFRTGVLNASLAGALAREQEVLDRERVLRALGTSLVGATDRSAVAATTVEHARRLGAGDAEALVLLGESRLDAVAATEGLSGTVAVAVERADVPPAVLAELTAGRAVSLDRVAAPTLRAALPDALKERVLFLMPLVTGGTLTGAVLLGVHRLPAAPDRLLAACDTLGSTVSLALEASQLAEKLVDQRSEQRFGAMIRNSSDIILVLHADATARFISPSVTRILGWEVGDVLGRHIADLVHPDDTGRIATAVHAAVSHPGTHVPIECRARHKDGSWRSIEAISTSLIDDPTLRGVVLNVRDVTDRVRLENELTHQALHDSLTGLANRALFLDRLEHAVDRATRSGTRVGILSLDIDNFKTVNDSLGHPVGDAVLLAVADRLRTCLRASDTAARFGGDEFTVLLSETQEDVAAVAERIVAAMHEPIVVEGQEVTVKASVGTATGDAGVDAAGLIRRADLALYVAKSEGKDRCVVFRPEMLDQFLAELELEQALRGAVAAEELDVHYQPIVDLATGVIAGAEALVRWVHPTRGYVSPAELIRIAERSDLIETIGRFVMRTACRFAATSGALSHVAVNVSARQLVADAFIDDVTTILSETGLSPHALVVEITESMLLDDLGTTVERLDALRFLGVRIAIDDFGTGYSSLSYLERLPVDVLKVDRSFTVGVGGGDERNLVPAILELARTLGLRTVAEGVETEAQGLRLAELGCDLAQGFYFSRAVPEADLVELLASPPATSAGWAAKVGTGLPGSALVAGAAKV